MFDQDRTNIKQTGHQNSNQTDTHNTLAIFIYLSNTMKPPGHIMKSDYHRTRRVIITDF